MSAHPLRPGSPELKQLQQIEVFQLQKVEVGTIELPHPLDPKSVMTVSAMVINGAPFVIMSPEEEGLKILEQVANVLLDGVDERRKAIEQFARQAAKKANKDDDAVQ